MQERSIARKAGRVVLIACSVIMIGILALLGFLLIISPGKPMPLRGADGAVLPGSISEKIVVDINGVEQGMFIRTKNENNPVLLLIHGGPGMPEFFLVGKYPTGFEDVFTVCYWEQRGAGVSFDPKASADALTSEQLIDDTIAVTDYLRARFHQDKVYLMAHSGGSYVGIKAAERAPERYAAYIGVAQVANQRESERRGYSYTLEQFEAQGNEKMVQKLKAYDVLTDDAALDVYSRALIRDIAMHQLGIGTMHDMDSIFTGVFFPVFGSRAYTLGEKFNIWRGKALSQSRMRDFVNSRVMIDEVPALDIPTYFFSGKYDYTVNYALAKDYLHAIKAPVKGFYTFENSAHSPTYEEPERTMEILRTDVLNQRADLADVD